jgi:DNA-binding response OmpR family regulator
MAENNAECKERGSVMAARTKTEQSLVDPDSTSVLFLNEDLVSIPSAGVPDEFRKLSDFLPVVVLIPKSAVHKKTGPSHLASNDFVAGLNRGPHLPSPAAAVTWLQSPSAADMFVFGEVAISFSAMEARRNGQLVPLTRKEFKTLAYLIKNAGRVISRDELLNEVWGYQSYPCTRTVDNHILQLRIKLEAEPARPKHFLTVRGTGYKFLP